MSQIRRVLLLLGVVLLLAGCASVIPDDFPADPDGTLDRVRSEGVLRVGASPRPGWVDVADEQPAGREPRLVSGFADHLAAEVEWTVAGEEELVRMLEDGEIDLAVGGFTDTNAWVDKVGLTRAYTETEVSGATEAHVMMVPMGENALQSDLERWLDTQPADGGAPVNRVDAVGGSGHWFGHAELPPEQADALGRAKRLEVVTVLYMLTCVAVVFATAGSSQAMKTAWVEDALALVPPLAFLLAVHLARRRPTADHPYGFHRATGVGHLTAAIALLAVGLLLAVDSTMSLLRAEHPPIGTVRLAGQTFWAGWLMVAAMVYTGIGPFVLGRMKLPLAEQLHDKVLYADADMQKADWMTAAGTIAGVLGIGVGLWWADSGAALLISLSIVRDGWTNLHYATTALMDERARTYDDEHPHPLTRRVDEALVDLAWVDDSRSRVRDQGHVFHVESFVRPVAGRTPTLDQLEAAADVLRELDWKVHDVVVVPVRDLPETIPDPRADGG